MFFDSQPNFLYPDFKIKDNYKVSKNFFRRVRNRENFNCIFSSSLPYTVTPGETVEEVAYKNRWISGEDLLKLSKSYPKSGYGDYLNSIVKERVNF